jgi:hypothetical protein
LFEIFKRVISHKWTWSFLYKTFFNFFFSYTIHKYALTIQFAQRASSLYCHNVNQKEE